jgi:allantoinase
VAADLVIRGGMVIGAEGGRAADVVIDAGSISALTDPGAGGPSRRLIDATGLAVFPGAIDAHVHFDAPGRDEWEGWETGSLAAVAGGVTTVIDMPIDSDPPTIDVPAVQAKCAAAQASSLVDFGLWGGLVPQNQASLGELLRSGVIGLKAFMCDSGWADFPPCDVDTLSVGMAAAAGAGRPVAVHCEDPSHFGPGEEDRPELAELSAVTAACEASAACGARLHVVHCSSAEAVVRAKRWPLVSVETCPHYLVLTDVDVARIGPDAVCCPPVRDEDNRRGLWRALREGLIDSIASDHSPCPPSYKERQPPFAGISGVQTTLSVLLSSGVLTLTEVSRLRTAAARLFGLARKGAVAPGYDADLALVDLHASWSVNSDTLRDRHGRSPFRGEELRGVVETTLVRGNVVYEAGLRASDPIGRFLLPESELCPQRQNERYA